MSVAIRGELLRTARTLGVDAAEIEFLAKLGAPALRTLRELIAEALLDADRRGFERAVSLTRVLPPPLAATVAQRALGPTLGARAAALLSPEQASKLAPRLPAPFLAEVATVIDERRVAPIVVELEPELIADVAVELSAREEWVVMGTIVGLLPDASLDAALRALSDEAILRTALLVWPLNTLDRIVGHLEDRRLIRLGAAAQRLRLTADLTDVRAALGPEQRRRFDGLMQAAA